MLQDACLRPQLRVIPQPQSHPPPPAGPLPHDPHPLRPQPGRPPLAGEPTRHGAPCQPRARQTTGAPPASAHAPRAGAALPPARPRPPRPPAPPAAAGTAGSSARAAAAAWRSRAGRSRGRTQTRPSPRCACTSPGTPRTRAARPPRPAPARAAAPAARPARGRPHAAPRGLLPARKSAEAATELLCLKGHAGSRRYASGAYRPHCMSFWQQSLGLKHMQHNTVWQCVSMCNKLCGASSANGYFSRAKLAATHRGSMQGAPVRMAWRGTPPTSSACGRFTSKRALRTQSPITPER